LDEVAADTYRLTPSRLVSAAVAAVVVGFGLGAMIAVGWLLSLLAGEGLAYLVTRRFRSGRVGTARSRALFVWASVPINASWAVLAALLWLQGHGDTRLGAVAIWCGQLVYTQNFRHQSAPLLVLNGLAPMVSLIVFPFFFLPGDELETLTARWGLFLLVATTINVMLLNRAAARRMDDLTRDLRQEREKALEAARAKSTFIAVASHELRTPMNGLLGMAHALENSDLSAAQREQVELMIRSGDSLMHLLNDVLDLSRIETGRIELALADIDPRILLNEVANAWRDAAAFKGLTLTVDIAPDLPTTIHADDLRIRQVLTNLVSNAIKFTAVGGVTIEARPVAGVDDRRMIAIAVSDSGPGVPDHARERVFDSFTQADETVSRDYGGAGLGLSIARALARRMGGDLTLAPSETGARFVFRFEAAEAVAREAEPQDVLENAPPLDQVRVLIAEDNAVNQLVARAMLEPLGVILTVVDNGQDALEAMGDARYDCVLMDINMPVMDGVTALEAIRAGRVGAHPPPIIALTASAMAGDRERFLEMGFDDHLGKPIRPAELVMAIASVVDGASAGGKLRGAA
jgi:signal transduction histidine kinase/CheY-like chemotaxis protein